MASSAANPSLIRFGAYEVDLRTGELRKHGLRIKLQDQPFQILAMLLERPGELVTREQIKERLWPAETFVDFDHSVNTAIRRLRDALSDSADQPRYVETLPRRGYRFIAGVQPIAAAEPPAVIAIAPPAHAVDLQLAEPPTLISQGAGFTRSDLPPVSPSRRRFRPYVWIAAALVVLIVTGFLVGRSWFQRRFTSALLQSGPGIDATSGGIQSIAVLPFVNNTGDADLNYITDGIAESIIDSLSELPDLKVMSRNSAFQYRSRPVDARAVGKSLGVGALVLGSLQKSGDKLRVSVELVDAREDRHLWGNQWEIWVDDMANLQRDVSGQISQNLRLRLSADSQRRIARRHTTNPLAYLAYLRGRYQLNHRVNDQFRSALDQFQKAVDEDPEYAPAYSGMSAAYGLLAFYGGMNPGEALRLEEAATRRALEIDPSLPEAHINQAYAYEALHHDFVAAEREMRRAIELNPQLAEGHHGLSLLLADAGRFEEALPEAVRAEQLDPLWPGNRSSRAWILYYAGRYQEAIDILGMLGPNFIPAHWSRGMTLMELHRYDEGIKELESISASSEIQQAQLANAYAVVGRAADARRILANLLKKRESRTYISAFNIASIYAGLNEPAPAIDWLRTADREFDPWIFRLQWDPRFKSIRSVPEFKTLVAEIQTPR
jgi:TolB-like protein/DNA-binding winged helix-turn-helix (wHTH) protein/Tfp pilus assembly protein PilF